MFMFTDWGLRGRFMRLSSSFQRRVKELSLRVIRPFVHAHLYDAFNKKQNSINIITTTRE